MTPASPLYEPLLELQKELLSADASEIVASDEPKPTTKLDPQILGGMAVLVGGAVAKMRAKAQAEDVEKAFEAWNGLAGRVGLPAARKLDEGRRAAIKARLADGGLETWMQALAGVERSRHCRGENDRGWKADLDFVCQPKSWRRLLEGFYGADAAPASAAPAAVWTGPPELRAAILGLKGPDWCVGFFDRCGWQDVPERTLLAPNRLVERRIRDDAGDLLARMNIKLEERWAA